MTNLLLLLSAMLSALIGEGQMARVGGTPAAAVAGGQVQAQAAARPVRVAAQWPPQPTAVLADMLVAGCALILFVPALVPAWANRRRE